MTKAPGKNFLLVTGILYIVFNAFAAMIFPLTMLTINSWLWMFGGEAMRDMWMLLYTLAILLSLFAVAVGIMGVAFCNKIHKAGLLLGVVIVCTALSIIFNLVYTAAILNFSGEMGFLTIIGIPFGLVLPILFIIGAVKNKKAADAAPYEREWR